MLDGLLPARADTAGRPGADAADRRTAYGDALCGRAHVEPAAQTGRPAGRQEARFDLDAAAHGHPCVVSQAEYQQTQPAHKAYPYLLRHLEIARPNHVWAADITYIPMKRGFVYLFAVMDWASRRVLAWRISNTLTTDFCIEAGSGGVQPLRPAGSLQHRPGLPVYQPRFHGTAERQRHPDQHGRQRLLAG
jgi:transposase InsO family protein